MRRAPTRRKRRWPAAAIALAASIAYPCGAWGTENAARADATSADWPQLGGSPSRNRAPPAKGLPAEWDVGRFDFRTGQWQGTSDGNVKWVAKLGGYSYGSPVVVGNKVFSATNNEAGYLDRYPAHVDLGCLLAFRRADGRFLWQHSAEKLKAGNDVDYEKVGICSTPLVERDRLWLVTNRAEVVCLDTEGFQDGQNDGPFRSEPRQAPDESDVVWRYDMIRELGIVPRYMANCSPTAAGDLLLVCTSNGVDSSGENVPAPDAPSFIALNKQTGALVWADHSPGRNVLGGQWASPAFAVLGGTPQAIFAGGDGWLYSFLAEATDDGKPRLLWKFDCNPKQSDWDRGDRNSLVATPVIYGGRVYIATGRDPQEGEDQGDLWCIDPTRRGDTSAELVVDRSGNPVPPRRTTAVDEQAGESIRPNPNSAALWHYRGHDANGDGQLDFKETMHRALAMVAVAHVETKDPGPEAREQAPPHATISDQRSAVSNQQSAISNQQSAVSRQPSAVSNQQSATINHQSSIFNHQSSIFSRQSSIFNHQSSVISHPSTRQPPARDPQAPGQDLLVIGDYSGLVHCLDADTGRCFWTYDAMATIWGSPLVADGKIYIGDEGGDVSVFELSATLNLLAKNDMGNSVYTTPAVAHNVLYVATRSHLIAIGLESD